MIVRGGGWRPEDGEIVRGCRLEGGSERRRRRQRKSRESRRSSRKHRRRRSGESYDSVDRLSRVHSSDADSDSDSEECVIDSTLLVDRIRQVEPLIEPSKWKIHGYYSLPESYAGERHHRLYHYYDKGLTLFVTVATLTPAAVIQPLSTSNAESGQITLSNSYGVVKSFAAVVQIVSSVYSLYSAYGSQVNRFGYAAFAFSVLPYTIMSTLNAVANLIEADYDSLFLVRSDVMAEAEKREGGEFIGEVAELKPVSSEVERCEASDRVDLKFHRDPRTGDWKAYEVDEAGLRKSPRTYLLYIPTLETYSRRLDDRPKLYIPAVGRLYEADVMLDRKARKFHGRAVSVIITISLMIPYIVIGVISKFRVQSSTVQQRVLMMGWLIVGQIIGIMELASGKGGKHQWWIYLERAVVTFIVILGFAFAVGGFVVSARMFRDFGYCLRL